MDDPYRDYYVWRGHAAETASNQVVFPGEEDSHLGTGTKTGEWYLHHFDKHQPDLNVMNSEGAGRDLGVHKDSGSSWA